MKQDYKDLIYNFETSGMADSYRYEDDELKDRVVFFVIKPESGIISPKESYTDPKTGMVCYKKVIRK